MAEDTFSFFLTVDAVATGDIKVIVYKDQNVACEGEGNEVFSKIKSGKLPSDDWDSFITSLQQAITEQ